MSKQQKPGEIVAKRRQVDGVVAQGTPLAAAIRSIGVSQLTDSRWRRT